MAQGLIEVERKFTPGPGTEQRLQELGGTLERQVTFRDTYYDTPELSLMRADHWLRQRENRGWELKCPGPAGVPGPHTEYRELLAEPAIVTQLLEVLGTPLGMGAGSVAAALGPLGLQEVASFVTKRSAWKLVLPGGAGEEEPVLRVDLDTADFGYAVGEVEALVREEADVPTVLEKIHGLSSLLGKGRGGCVVGEGVSLSQKFPKESSLLQVPPSPISSLRQLSRWHLNCPCISSYIMSLAAYLS